MTTEKSTFLYGVGIFLLVLGTFLFMTFWLMILGFITLGLGGLLILISGKKWILKLITIGLPYGFVIGTIIYSYAQPETFLIPQDFKGVVYVVFNQMDGQPKEFEGRRRIYKIPKSGILFSQFGDNDGILNQEFYYVNSSGQRTKLGVLDSRHFNDEWTINPRPTDKEPPRDSLAVFNPGTVGTIVTSDRVEKYTYTALTVGTYMDVRQNLNYIDPDRIDSLKRKIDKENAR